MEIEFIAPKVRSYYWTDAYRVHVRTDVYQVGDIEIHVPDTAGHFVELHMPDGQEVRVGVVR